MTKEITTIFLLLTTTLLSCQSKADQASDKDTKQVTDSTELASDTLHAETVHPELFETVNIGGVEITNENCSLLEYRNGDPIPLAWNAEEWNKYTAAFEGCAAYVYFDSACVYGIVYNGFVVADSRNIAPEGYHVATIEEYRNMANSLDTSETAHLGLKSDLFWETPGTNTTGFNAIPTGYYSTKWDKAQTATSFWTSTPTHEDKL